MLDEWVLTSNGRDLTLICGDIWTWSSARTGTGAGISTGCCCSSPFLWPNVLTDSSTRESNPRPGMAGLKAVANPGRGCRSSSARTFPMEPVSCRAKSKTASTENGSKSSMMFSFGIYNSFTLDFNATNEPLLWPLVASWCSIICRACSVSFKLVSSHFCLNFFDWLKQIFCILKYIGQPVAIHVDLLPWEPLWWKKWWWPNKRCPTWPR